MGPFASTTAQTFCERDALPAELYPQQLDQFQGSHSNLQSIKDACPYRYEINRSHYVIKKRSKIKTHALRSEGGIKLKAELVAEARSRESELALTSGDGLRWTAEGDGCIARVTVPAPTLKAEIDENGKAPNDQESGGGRVFTHLFVPTTRYRPLKFREEAAALPYATMTHSRPRCRCP